MDATHLHLLLNHFPVLGTLFGFCLLAYGVIRKNGALEKAGLVTLVIIALLGIPAFLSGESAEHAVENLPGVSEYYIEQHEELAKIGFWLMIATGSLALFTYVFSLVKNKKNTLLKVLTVFLAAGTFGIMVMVGNYGGSIRHSELRGDTPGNVIQGSGAGTGVVEHDDDD